MSHMSHLAAMDRPDSRVSLALSDTTYHSFQDIDLHEPGLRPRPAIQVPTVSPSPAPREQKKPMPREMRRQDSGYESISGRDSLSSRHRTSSSTSLSSSTRQRRTKPSTQRSSRSGPVSHRPRNGRHSVSPPGSAPSSPLQTQPPVTYFHFPNFTSSDPALADPEPAIGLQNLDAVSPGSEYPARSESPAYVLPPQTTHYWTSDRTRRLEYAAIDAASKGVRGWVMRHVVPDCFVPQSKRRIGFEDDRGSVVRYRLELDTDEGVEKAEGGRSGWRGWLRRR